jgi:hypothetical protein
MLRNEEPEGEIETKREREVITDHIYLEKTAAGLFGHGGPEESQGRTCSLEWEVAVGW